MLTCDHSVCSMPPHTRRRKTQEEHDMQMQRGRPRNRSPVVRHESRGGSRDRSPISHQDNRPPRREATPHPGANRRAAETPRPESSGRGESDAWWASDNSHQAAPNHLNEGLLHTLLNEVEALKRQLKVFPFPVIGLWRNVENLEYTS